MRPSRKPPLYRGFEWRQRARRSSGASRHELHTHSDLASFNRATVARRRTKAEIAGRHKPRLAKTSSGRGFADHAALVQILVQADDAGQFDPAVPASGARRVVGANLADGGACDQTRSGRAAAGAGSRADTRSAACPLPALAEAGLLLAANRLVRIVGYGFVGKVFHAPLIQATASSPSLASLVRSASANKSTSCSVKGSPWPNKARSP